MRLGDTALIHNERIKLIATYLNNLAVGAFLAGAIIPQLRGTSTLNSEFWIPFAGGMFFAAVFQGAASVIVGYLVDTSKTV